MPQKPTRFPALLETIEARNPSVDGPAHAWCQVKPDGEPKVYIKIVNGEIVEEGGARKSYKDATTAMRNFWNGWQREVPDGAHVIWRSRPALVQSGEGFQIVARFVVGELQE